MVPGRALLAEERGYTGGRELVFVGLGGGNMPWSTDGAGTDAFGEESIGDLEGTARAGG